MKAIISGIASFFGHTFSSGFSPQVIATTIAIAEGAILTMISSMMMLEAYENAHYFAGLISVLGSLAAFIISKLNA